MPTASTKHTEPSRAREPLEVRRMRFGLGEDPLPIDWYGGDLYLSSFWCALSLVFPEGERFFVESVRHYRDRVEDPELRAAIRAFAGQEAMHGKEHRTLNEILWEDQPQLAERREREVLALLDLARKVLPSSAQLAVTCALEHYTAIMAEQLLELEGHQQAIHPAVRPVWLWHALEESEHKAVAYDVFQEVSGSYALRSSIMLLTTAFFIGEISHIHLRLLAARGELTKPRRLRRGVVALWGRDGLLRGLLPSLMAYFRTDFHPDQAYPEERLGTWRDALFRAGGTLHDVAPARAA